jgi:hypothetical protein
MISEDVSSLLQGSPSTSNHCTSMHNATNTGQNFIEVHWRIDLSLSDETLFRIQVVKMNLKCRLETAAPKGFSSTARTCDFSISAPVDPMLSVSSSQVCHRGSERQRLPVESTKKPWNGAIYCPSVSQMLARGPFDDRKLGLRE